MQSVSDQLLRLLRCPGVVLLLCANLIVFGFELAHINSIDSVFYRFGVVASHWRLSDMREIAALPGLLSTLITSQFVHAGWTHIFFNLLFLAVFGPAIESRVGFFRFVVLFLCSGMGATAVHLIVQPATSIPLVGASGSVAGVLGAYLLLFPNSPIRIRVPRTGGKVKSVPAFGILGIWFVLIWLQGIAGIGDAIRPGQGAFWVHISGFLLGMIGAVIVHPSNPKP